MINIDDPAEVLVAYLRNPAIYRKRKNWMTLRNSAADMIEQLTVERDDFYMDYRVKCDEETKAAHTEIERLTAESTTLGEALSNMAALADSHAADNCRLQARVEELEAKLYRKDACMKAWKQSSDEHEARVETLDRVREILVGMRYDHIKYPQLRLPDMQADRMNRALAATEQGGRDE